MHRSRWEPRPDNRAYNTRTATRAELERFRQLSNLAYRNHVTGAFIGTTDEIIQWAAWKWGVDENVLRAVAAVESWWNQGFSDGASYGLTQIKQQYFSAAFPLAAQSTAFNLDLYGELIRIVYDGRATWLGRYYRRGDFWGAIGEHFSGDWRSPAALQYIAQVKRHELERVWRTKTFRNGSGV